MRARKKPKKKPTVVETPTAIVGTPKKPRIVSAETTGDYRRLGAWVAQFKGLPQARAYGKDRAEAVGKLILSLGKENGIELLPAAELAPSRRERL